MRYNKEENKKERYDM